MVALGLLLLGAVPWSAGAQGLDMNPEAMMKGLQHPDAIVGGLQKAIRKLLAQGSGGGGNQLQGLELSKLQSLDLSKLGGQMDFTKMMGQMDMSKLSKMVDPSKLQQLKPLMDILSRYQAGKNKGGARKPAAKSDT